MLGLAVVRDVRLGRQGDEATVAMVAATVACRRRFTDADEGATRRDCWSMESIITTPVFISHLVETPYCSSSSSATAASVRACATGGGGRVAFCRGDRTFYMVSFCFGPRESIHKKKNKISKKYFSYVRYVVSSESSFQGY